MLSSRLGIHYNNYRLSTEEKQRSEFFGNINIYIPFFLKSLWKNPKSLAKILSITDINDIKNNLAHFVTHYFYENIYSLNDNQEQLLYIITLLLKEEIKNLEKNNESNLEKFLNKTTCGYILQELILKKEVKDFFKIILNKVIKQIKIIGMIQPLNTILFNPIEIYEKIFKGFYIIDNKLKNNNHFKDKLILFEQKYIIPLNKERLEEKCKEYKDTDVEKYLKKIIKKCESNQNYFSGERVINLIYSMNDPLKVFNYYKESFIKIVDLIDILLENLLINSKSIPYYIKCIFKIIVILIHKKFSECNKIELYFYASKFFFYKLLFISFEDPALYTLMNEYLILGEIKETLGIIESVLTKFIQGDFFNEDDFLVPFNNYFIEKIPLLIKIFDIIYQVELPSFINYLVNDKLCADYTYDYIRENPNKNIFYRHICFNAEIVYSLVINADKCKDSITLDKKVLEKLKNNIKELEKLKDYSVYNANEEDFFIGKKTVEYFLLSDTINNEKYENILNINREKNYFSLKEIKKVETEEQEIQNNIIKVKNFFYSFLYNFQILNKNDYNQENLKDIKSILLEIKNNINLNSSINNQKVVKLNPFLESMLEYLPILQNRNFSANKLLEEKLNNLENILNDIKINQNQIIENEKDSFQKQIPLKWFLGSLIQFLPKLPIEYIKNDYEKLLNELENELKNSIEEIDFEFLGETIDNIREIEKNKDYYQKVKNIIVDIDLNKQIDSIVKKEHIPIILIYKDDQIEIKPVPKKEKKIFKLKTKKEREIEKENICLTIKQFIERFPDLTIYERLQDVDIIELMKQMNLPEKLNVYFNVIKDYITEQNIVDKNNINDLYNKIYDYIMENLNEKLFPKEVNSKDNKIYKNCVLLEWIQPSNFQNMRQNYILDYYLPDAINYFKRIDEEKSPRKKFICIKEIFNCMYNLGKFNNNKVEGADEEMPLLNYTFIKANPRNIYANCRYMELFLGKGKHNLEGNQLTKIIVLCESFLNISYKHFINVTEEEFKEKCKLANQRE